MAGKSLFWLQSVASVLSFAPPGLLLIATRLHLRQIPVVRTSWLLNHQRLRISQATGSGTSDPDQMMANAGKSNFISRLNEAIERSCRRGDNPLPSIVVLEQLTRKTVEPLGRINDVLLGLSTRTFMAIVFAESLCGILHWIQPESGSDLRSTLLTAMAASCITTCGCLGPIFQIRKSAKLLDFSQGNTADRWIGSMQTSGAGIMAKRCGFAFDDDVATVLTTDFHDRHQSAMAMIM
ncbi:MAG: hypothetical protein EBU49_08245, partial [Proteobacteria bacterium]|nr:hypothetical protein [Pseudomonadota bacterium]